MDCDWLWYLAVVLLFLLLLLLVHLSTLRSFVRKKECGMKFTGSTAAVAVVVVVVVVVVATCA